MKNRMLKYVVLTCLTAALVGNAGADELGELRQQVDEQYKQLLVLQNKIMELEARQNQQDVVVQKLEAKPTLTIPETPTPMPQHPKTQFASSRT